VEIQHLGFMCKNQSCMHTHTHTHTQQFYISLDFVRDIQGEPVPEETFTQSHLSWSSVISHLLPSSIMIHGILPVQITYMTVFFRNLYPNFLWSTSWPGTLNFILHTFLHPVIVFFSQHMLIPSRLFCLVPRLCHLILVCFSTFYLELSLVA